MTTMRVRGQFVAALVLAACSSSGSSSSATPEQRAQAERRLLEPFLVAREVGCTELQIEVTSNLYSYVGQPAVDSARHTKTREQGNGFVDTVWTNRAGAADAAFVVTVGEPQQVTEKNGLVLGKQTRFRVVNQVRLRVYEDRRLLTLNARAGGAFILVKDAAAAPREVAHFAIVDGVLQRP